MNEIMDNVEMLNELLELEEGLTEWETGFLESVSEQYEERATLTERQIDKIQQIHADRT